MKRNNPSTTANGPEPKKPRAPHSQADYDAAFKKLGNKASVIGIGKLGLCFALSIEKIGYDVLGVDIFPDYVAKLNSKEYKSDEPDVVDYLKSSKKFRATTDLDEAIGHADVIFILIATPTVGGRFQYDHSNLGKLLTNINRKKVKNKHIVISSTVMPGYIRRIARPLLSDCTNVTVSYNPAFVAQGDVMKGYRTGGFFGLVLVGGDSDLISNYLHRMYQELAHQAGVKVHVAHLSPESAEIAKISSNCFRTMKISFANMIGDICDRTPGADKDEVCDALGHDESVGARCMKPGYGYGGPCYPRDNVALYTYADSVGVNAFLSRASDESNKWHAGRMVENFLQENKDVYTFTQVAYKPNCPVPMIDESHKLIVAEGLAKAGKRVIIKDSDAVIDLVRQEFGSIFEYQVDAKSGYNASLKPSEVHY